MQQSDLQTLIGRVLTDQAFRERLLANPEGTLAAEGYAVTPEVLAAIKKVNPADVNSMAQEFEEQFANRQAA